MAKNQLTLEIREKFLQLMLQGLSPSELSEELNVPRRTIYDWKKRLESDTALSATEEKDKIRSLEAQLKTIQRETLSVRYVKEQILNLSKAKPNPPKWVAHASKYRHEDLVPVTMWSDWHWGEVVAKDQINGINSYSLEIAHEGMTTIK